MYSPLKDLPESIQTALSSLGYYKNDIFIEAKETVDISSCAGDGMRGFYAMFQSLPADTRLRGIGCEYGYHWIFFSNTWTDYNSSYTKVSKQVWENYYRTIIRLRNS